MTTPEVVERARRMLENGATRQQIADVIGVGVKTIYNICLYNTVIKNPLEQAHSRGKYYITSLLCASLRSSIFQEDA